MNVRGWKDITWSCGKTYSTKTLMALDVEILMCDLGVNLLRRRTRSGMEMAYFPFEMGLPNYRTFPEKIWAV